LTNNISIRSDSTALADVSAQPVWLASQLDAPDIGVVEVDVSRAAYDQGHIPGAILWNAYTDLHHAQDYSPLERSEFEELLRRSGFTPDTTIIFYGYGPYLGFWLTKAYGHQRALVLGGRGESGARRICPGRRLYLSWCRPLIRLKPPRLPSSCR
jgi:3-mercaptopyruvate sulfurtransferase SseA